ncbi:GntR family transcriptional regulator [Streptomyces boninensis]|uniref:GntR family transcriptional regulator n=1 Tax=Streptomyces boninensis TaxID=2039455 RepID=UPI003B227BD1
MNGSASPEDVADALRDSIRSGELRPGATLPTQKKLAEQFGVERGTVRQALERLKAENLLTNVGRGSPPKVAERPAAEADDPQPAITALLDRILGAFRQQHVVLDAFSLTTETLNAALQTTHSAIIRREIDPPDSLKVRLMVPTPDTRLALPKLVDDLDDPRPLRRLQKLMLTQLSLFEHNVTSLARPENVDFTIKTVPVTPSFKLYLLNSTEALMGYYPVFKNVVPDDTAPGSHMEIYDFMGHTTKLFRSRTDELLAGSQDPAFVQESQSWFDSWWDTIAQEYDPSGQ